MKNNWKARLPVLASVRLLINCVFFAAVCSRRGSVTAAAAGLDSSMLESVVHISPAQTDEPDAVLIRSS